MSANWDASFETRERDKNSKPQRNFVALLVVEGGVEHSGRLCVCGWWQCGGDTDWGEVQVDRAPWGAHPCCPCTRKSPFVLALQSKLRGQKKPGCVTTLCSPSRWGSPAQPAPVKIRPWTGCCYPECPCPSQSPRSCKQLTLRSASPPALSLHPSLPPARWSHYRTQLLLHVESW